MKRLPRRERVRIYVEGSDDPAAELALDLALRAGLAPGQDLDEAELAPLLREDQSYRAREAALTLLAHRARSTVEIRRRLARKDIAAAVIDATVQWLTERGYLDDASFAESFVRDRVRLRPRGRLGLISELRRKGVAEATSAAAVERVLAAESLDEATLAREAADAWARKNPTAIRNARRSRDDRQRARRRLYGHLARRGFSPDAVRAGLESALGE